MRAMTRKTLATFACVVTTTSALAQGTVKFANFVRYFSSPPVVDAPFFDEQGNRIQGSNYIAQIFVWMTNDGFVPAGDSVPFVTNGYFLGGTVALPGGPGGAPAWVQVRAWQVVGGHSFEEAALAGAWTGLSEILFLPYTGNPYSPGVPTAPVDLTGLHYPGKPLLLKQPQSKTIGVGVQLTVSVIPSTGVAASYQWFQQPSDRPDGLIVGATNAAYTTPPLSTNATYWVSISNSAGSVLSDKATVTVVPAAPRLALEQVAGLPLLTLDGPMGITYRIEYSTNLNATNWTSLVELSLSATPFIFSDSGWSNSPARFYRAIAP